MFITCAATVTEMIKPQKGSASALIQSSLCLCAPRAGLGAGCPVPMTTGDAVGVSLSRRSDPQQAGGCWANILN